MFPLSLALRLRMKALSPFVLIPLLLLPALRAAADTTGEPVAAPPATQMKDVVDLSAPSAEFIPVPTQVDLVSVARAPDEMSGLDVLIRPGPANYPGINFRLTPGTLDLSGFGYVEARLTNTGAKAIHVTLRIDSASVPALNLRASEAFGRVHLTPGGTGAVRAYFAHPKKGMGPFHPGHLDMILIYLGKDENEARSFRLESVTAGGVAGELPPAAH